MNIINKKTIPMNINIANLILYSHFISIVSNLYVKISFFKYDFRDLHKTQFRKNGKHLITN